jgi:hypothetical protein
MGQSGERGAVDLRDALQEARAALRRPDTAARIPSTAPIPSAAPPPAQPRSLFDDALPLPSVARPRAATLHALHRPPRPRRQHTPAAPSAGLQMGDRFRLSEPPEISEPHGPLSFNANWFAAAALVGATAYYLMR